MSDDILNVAGLIFVSGLLPGPNVALVIARSMEFGRRAALFTALGLATGAFTYAVLGLLGMSVVFEAYPALIDIVKILGASYLGWIGLQALRKARNSSQVPMTIAQEPASFGWKAPRLVLEAWFVQIANPETLIFFSALFTALETTRRSVAGSVEILLTVFVSAGTLYSLMASMFSSAKARDVYSKAETGLDVVFGISMLLVAFIVLVSVTR